MVKDKNIIVVKNDGRYPKGTVVRHTKEKHFLDHNPDKVSEVSGR